MGCKVLLIFDVSCWLFMGYSGVDVSVVIPCFRSVGSIKRALDSVDWQTARPAEVIIVDDFSGDGSLLELERIAETYADNWVRVIGLEKNGGPGTARNAGWDVASKKYVAFLDADDAWHPKKLELQYGWMEMNPDVAMTGHSCTVKQEGKCGFQDEQISVAEFLTVTRRQLLRKNLFSTQTVMVRRDIPFRFLAGKKYSEDYLLACEVCFGGGKCAASKAPLAYLYKEAYGAGGLSGNLLRMEVGELEVYGALYRSGMINYFERILYSAFSFAKFMRRCVHVLLRRVKLGG